MSTPGPAPSIAAPPRPGAPRPAKPRRRRRAPALAWSRPRTETTDAARRRIWQSRCGRFRVVRSRCLYGPRDGPQALAVRWYAMILTIAAGRPVWDIVSTHRKRGPAFAACDRAASREAR